MTEIIKIFLENEMDLILAQQRSMKLAEFTGLSLSAQTSFGTAVSEVCRHVLDRNNAITLVLGIQDDKDFNALAAKITHNKKNITQHDEAILFATRLVDKVMLNTVRNNTLVELYERLPPRQRFGLDQFDEWRYYFRNQAPISPYEEVKQKNIQLKELTIKLAQSEQQYKTLAESLPLGIFTTNDKGELVYGNKWFNDFAGQQMKDVQDSNWSSLVHNEDLSAIQNHNKGSNEDPYTSEYRLKNKNGDYVWHIGQTVPVVYGETTDRYHIGYFADINAQKLVEQTLKDNKELKEAQKELARYQAELEQHIAELNQSNFELAQFAYVTSHDLQEPLRKLMLYNDTLQHKFLSNIQPEVQYIMSRMTECCARMRALIADLLSFSKIRKDDLHMEKVDLNTVIKSVLENLDQAIEDKKARITVDKLPLIEASARHLAQLFENLIGNSLKYARPGIEPVISLSVVPNTGNNLVLKLTDNGIGFENEFAERIFGLFQRLHNKNEYDGTGIGLALCRKITDLHNGSINAEGVPGIGATFTVTLPLARQK